MKHHTTPCRAGSEAKALCNDWLAEMLPLRARTSVPSHETNTSRREMERDKGAGDTLEGIGTAKRLRPAAETGERRTHLALSA